MPMKAPDWYYCLGCTAKHVMTATCRPAEPVHEAAHVPRGRGLSS